jgi:hypothetical protein
MITSDVMQLHGAVLSVIFDSGLEFHIIDFMTMWTVPKKEQINSGTVPEFIDCVK